MKALGRFGSAVILAGGKSTRMGFDKQFIKLGEMSMLDRLLTELKAEFEELIIVTNRPEAYKNTEYIIVMDEVNNLGPLEGLRVGLNKSSSDYVYFIACDMPHVNSDFIRYMKDEIDSNNSIEALIPVIANRRQYFNTFYKRDISDKIKEQLLSSNRSLKGLVETLKSKYLDESGIAGFQNLEEMFLNLNTREELDQYMRSL